LYLFNIRTPFS